MGLMEQLPERAYHGEEHVQVMQQAYERQIQLLQGKRDDLFLQLRPATSTWGLARYEHEYGIAVDETLPKEQRLSALYAKMRGRGTMTKERIANIAQSYYNGPIEVIEHNDESWLEIEFKGFIGQPDNLDALRRILEELIPAHLALELDVLFVTHGQLRAFTHAELGRYTHEELRYKLPTGG